MGINYSKFHEQTVDSYRYVDYGGNSIYNSGCGPASLANALMVLGIADITVKAACEFAVFCGARIRDAGTNMSTLLKHAAEKWPITYRTTSSNAELAAHLRAGGVAIMNQGDTYKVFSNGGHYVVAAAIDNADRVTVIDSYWNTKKYKTWPKYHAKSEILSRCFVRTPLYWCGRATIDRSPSYYLISREVVTDTNPGKQDEEEKSMQYFETLDDIPEYYRDAVQKLVEKGAIEGTGEGKLNVSEDFCRTMTVLNSCGILDLKLNKLYKTVEDVPEYYQDAVKKLVDAGAIAGTGDGLNLSEDLCRTLTILDAAGVLDGVGEPVEIGEIVKEDHKC